LRTAEIGDGDGDGNGNGSDLQFSNWLRFSADPVDASSVRARDHHGPACRRARSAL